MPGIDDRLRSELERMARPADPSGAYERIDRRRARRRLDHRLASGALAVSVVAVTIVGTSTLYRAFLPASGGSDQVAFIRFIRACYEHPNVNEGLQVFTVDAATGEERLVSANVSVPSHAPRSLDFSPDGTRYAWVGHYDHDLYVTYVRTGESHLLTHGLLVVRPQFSKDGSKILFVVNEVGDLTSPASIYVVNADGSNLTELSQGSVPTWTDDGRIAFLRIHQTTEIEQQGGTIAVNSIPEPTEFFLMNVDGSAVEKVYEAPGDVQIVDADWSPDGVHVAAQVTVRGNSDIYVLGTEDRSVIRVTFDPNEDRSPSWSPDGSRIVYSSRVNGNREIVMANADGTGFTPLTTDGCWEDTEPVWIADPSAVSALPVWTPPPLPDLGEAALPQPDQFLFVDAADQVSDLHAADLDGGAHVKLTADLASDSNPRWSPDRTRIVFASDRDEPGNFDIYVMDAPTGAVTRLTTDAAQDEDPAWSPDGSRIAFIRESTLWVMDTDGTDARRISLGTDQPSWSGEPSWSSDGTRIAFAGYWSIWVVDADGSNWRRLTEGDPLETPDYEPEWSPDGSSILFTRGHDIYVMEADGSSVRLLTDGDPDTYDRFGTWSPDGSQILFASDRGPGDRSRFYVMNADGTDVRPVGDLTGMAPDW